MKKTALLGMLRRVILLMLFGVGVASLACGQDGTGETFAFPDLLGDESLAEDAPSEESSFAIQDPLEPMNRVFFDLNDGIYYIFLRPVTKGYTWLVPPDFRYAFDNFFFNLAAPVRLLNSFLQFDLHRSGIILSRFLINSTLGVVGLVDIAEYEFDLKRQKGEFEQTLSRWGVETGVYLCLPVFGPSTLRGSLGFAVDAFTHPVPYYFSDDQVFNIAGWGVESVNTFSFYPDLYDELKKSSLDPYIAARQAYFEYRKAFISQP